ncbi:MAG: NnrS family protein, partial [Rhizobiaceae bacterium]|nr:NnrS family protein [Rhizobiaceae bacterium]
VLISLIGGRIVPSFTRNWLVKQRADALPAPFGRLDTAALAATVLAMAGTVILPNSTAVGALLCLAGVLLAARLIRWRGAATLREPILFILHLGYGWLALALVLMGLAVLNPAIPQLAAIHALTAGAIGTMTLAVMTRASLGHTGRAIIADRAVVSIYVLVTAGAALRVAALFAGDWYREALVGGGTLWSAAFLLFAARFAPVLFLRRAG